jgi:uncharacterized protein YjiS (DUF1127 family)
MSAVVSRARGIAQLSSRFIQFLARRLSQRRDLMTLSRFDDRTLADIGLSRPDVFNALSQPIWDATEPLSTRGEERQAALERTLHRRAEAKPHASAQRPVATGAVRLV